MKSIKPLLILFVLLLAGTLAVVYLLPYLKSGGRISAEDRRGGTDMVLKNYGEDIDSAAALFGISPAYLKALCMLECSGKKVFPHRFEPHIYKRLKKVKFGALPNYEHVTRDMLQDANDDALKNLASSWGPFQLMGYKCLLLGIKVRDIRGPQSVYYGAKWIDMTYGDVLREKRYKDAFHIHNAGTKFPSDGRARTHDPQYIQRGLKYMQVFR